MRIFCAGDLFIMKYVISDIHGCYREYLALLDKIHFSADDWLYVLGDAADRGPEPIKVFRICLAGKTSLISWAIRGLYVSLFSRKEGIGFSR